MQHFAGFLELCCSTCYLIGCYWFRPTPAIFASKRQKQKNTPAHCKNAAPAIYSVA
jgi:hypothetical protein